MKKNFKRLWSLFITLCLVLGLIPISTVQVMADDGFDTPFTNDSGNKYVRINTNSYHNITLADTTNGSVSASVYSSPQEETVTLTITPDSHTFETVEEGYGDELYDYIDDVEPYTFTVENTGNVALAGLLLETEGDNGGESPWYSYSHDFPKDFEPNASTEITVTPKKNLSPGSYKDTFYIKKDGNVLASLSISLTVVEAEPSIRFGGTDLFTINIDFNGTGYSWDAGNKILTLTSEYEAGMIEFFHCEGETITLTLDGDVAIDEEESHKSCIYSYKKANMNIDLNNHTLILKTGGHNNIALYMGDVNIQNGTLEAYILGSETIEGTESIKARKITVDNAKIIAKGDSLNYGGIDCGSLILKQGAEIFASGKKGLNLSTADDLEFKSDEVSLTALGSEEAIYLDCDLTYPDDTELRNWSNTEAVQPLPVGEGTLLADIPSEIYSYIPPNTDITLLTNNEIWGIIWWNSKYVHIGTTALEAEVSGTLEIGNSTVSDLKQDANGTNWTWDASEGILSLNGNMDGDGMINFDASGDVTVTVNSNVDINQLAYKDGNGGKLTINGNGTLNIDSVGTGIMAGNGLEIDDVTIDIITKGQNDFNVNIIDGDFTMNSGRLNLCGNNGVTNGVHCDEGNIIISGTAEVRTTPSVTGYGFYAGKNVEITGGTVNLTSESADAIHAGGNLNISGDNTQVILNGVQVYPVSYSVTVNKGSGSGKYEEGELVTIVADEAEAGKQFDKWVIEPANITFSQGSITTSSSIFVMPGQAVTATAIYTDLASDTYAINVLSDGNGVGNANVSAATAGTEITLTAIANNGYQFKEWQVVSGNITIENNKFTMPSENVTVNGVFEAIPVNYTVSFDLNGGTRTGGGELTQTIVSGESAIAPTVTRSNYTFKGWDEDFSNVTSDLIITATWSYKGKSSGGGSSSGGSSSSEGGEQSEQTKSSSVTVTGSTATATLTGETNSDGETSVTITQSQMNNVIEAAQKASKKTDEAPRIEIQVRDSSSENSIETILPKEAINALVTGEVESLSISSKAGNVQFDAQAIATIANSASDDLSFTVSKVGTSGLENKVLQVVGDRPVYQLRVASGNKTISQFDGTVTVSLPYVLAEEEDKNAIVAYYINEDGELELMQNCYYDEEAGTLIFTTSHFSRYAIGYNKVTFDDVPNSAWYSEAITYLAARGITNGTSKNTFSPDKKLKRGDFITLLLRAYDIEVDKNVGNNFSDAGDTYYTDYLGRAKVLGISEGVGDNKFAPGQDITRQEMFTLLYKTLRIIDQLPEGDSGKKLLNFTDNENIDTYAKEAMEFLVETGVVTGNNKMLLPTETTTRGQMAQVLYNLMSQ